MPSILDADGGLDFGLDATDDGDALERTFMVTGNPPFGIRAIRAVGDVYAGYDAQQDSLRVANAPDPATFSSRLICRR